MHTLYEQEPATLPETMGKQIVTKQQYVANVGKKTAAESAVFAFLIVGILTGLGTLGSLSSLLVEYDKSTIFLIVGFAAASLACCHFAWRTLSKANSIQTGVPVTRSNTADLPALDSLVRASTEPVQAQESVLLRASVGQAQAGQEEQLLRGTTQ